MLSIDENKSEDFLTWGMKVRMIVLPENSDTFSYSNLVWTLAAVQGSGQRAALLASRPANRKNTPSSLHKILQETLVHNIHNIV